MPSIRVLLPNQEGESHVLKEPRITIGRRPDNMIQILDPSISAYHAELLLVGDHYRLHDLESTNLCFVDGVPVTDFHLHQSCKLSFGTVACEYDATPGALINHGLTPAEIDKDVAFLRQINLDLMQKIDTLQRQIDILSSARLVTGKEHAASESDATALKRLTAERDEARFQNVGLKLEVERLREEIELASRERDLARRDNELKQVERVTPAEGSRNEDKGTTQRIIFPYPQPTPINQPAAVNQEP